MKHIVAILSFFVCTTANAQVYYPGYGCFVVQGTSGSGICAVGTITCSSDYNLNVAYFGQPVAGLCAQVWDYYGSATECNTLLNQGNASLTECSNRFNVTEANRQEWIKYGTAQAALVKKLRRACGTKCKKIK